MKARSKQVSVSGTRAHSSKKAGSKPRMARGLRKAQIVNQATDFFAEHGLGAQTRALAAACGITQRLLYRYFPSKSALLEEVFQEAIVAPFKAVWLIQLRDRSRPFDQRLMQFYQNYYAAVLTRKWLRLFVYDSLQKTRMAPDYIQTIILEILETIVAEAAHDQAVKLPSNLALIHEIGWTLHGAVSHLAIRRHLYMASQQISERMMLTLHVRGFIACFSVIAAEACAIDKSEN